MYCIIYGYLPIIIITIRSSKRRAADVACATVAAAAATDAVPTYT